MLVIICRSLTRVDWDCDISCTFSFLLFHNRHLVSFLDYKPNRQLSSSPYFIASPFHIGLSMAFFSLRCVFLSGRIAANLAEARGD
jgi:hypothetical protein